MATIALDKLEKSYGANKILKGITATINDGELVALLGPSGCGKTTTLRCIAGFEIPDSGTINLDGKDITTLLPEQRNLGMVFQNYALFPHLTVFENVAFGLRMRKRPEREIRSRVDNIMRIAGLEGYDLRYPRMLSGGQQQRVAIARALVIEPMLLLLDEPLANLDAKLREEMRFYLKELQKNMGITMIYVTHDQAEALVLSDRIIVMFEGLIHQNAEPEILYRRPATLRVANFIGLINFFNVSLAGMDGNEARVTASFGDLVCGQFSSQALQGCRSAKAGVRPESVMICGSEGEAPAQWNRLKGRVEMKTYIGNMFDYRIRVSDSDLMRIQASPAQDLAVGSECFLSFAPEQMILLPDE